jgi:hypothetical protein
MYLREDGTPYYIGQGRGGRIDGKNKRRHDIELPPKDRRRFLKVGLTEEESIRHETYMISVLGRLDNGTGILENKQDGGKGSPGRILSEESREKIRNSLEEFRNTPEGRKVEEQKIRKQRQLKWWNNGEQEVRSLTLPGEGWNRGRLFSMTPKERKEREREQKRRWDENNRERKRQLNREYYQKNKEKKSG